MAETVFVLQKIIFRLLFPVGVTLTLCSMGLLLWSRRIWSLTLIATGVAVLLIFSFPLTGFKLIGSIESQVPAYAQAHNLVRQGVRYVVVLSGSLNEGDLSAADRLGPSVLRLIEGVRLWKSIPDARLVVTGGPTPGVSREMSIARALADMAMEMRVPRGAIVLEEKSWTTADQARFVKSIVGRAPFVLVTSAYHLPRSLLLFRMQGLDPIPAPCDFLAKRVYIDYETLMPQAYGLLLSQIAVKEYLATWWFLLKAHLSGTLHDATNRTAP